MRFGLDTVPVSFRRRIKRFVSAYLGTNDLPVPFGGRSAEIAELNEWLTDPQAPANLLVAAEAGRGKTALLIRWLDQLDSTWPIAFIPISIRYETSRPAIFFQAFAGRLAYLLKEALPTALGDPAEFYKEKVGEYLERLEEQHERCLVVIDGLDEATGWRFDSDLVPSYPGSNLRVLVSARILAGDREERGWLRRLDWDSSHDSVRVLRIPQLSANAIADVLRCTDPALRDLSTDKALIGDLQRLSGGDPLLLNYYIDDIRRSVREGRLEELRLAESEAGFGAYFHDWLRRQDGIYQTTSATFEEQVVKAILAVLACAIGPLTLRNLIGLVERLIGPDHIIARDSIQPLERFVVGDGIDIGYALGHPKLRQFIREEYFGASDILSRAAQAFVDWGRDTIAALRTGAMRHEDVSPYLLQFHAQHLMLVGAPPDAYAEMVSSAWRKAWEADREGEGYLGLSNDVDVARRALMASLADAPPKERTWLLAAALDATLLAASIRSLSAGIPAELLTVALRYDALAVGSALHFAMRREPEARLQAVAAVAGALPPARRRTVLEDAVAALSSIAEPAARSAAITDIAPLLPADLLPEVFDVACNLKDERSRCRALAGLVLHLDGDAQAEALDLALATPGEATRAELIASVGPQLPDTLLPQTIKAARALSILEARARALQGVARALDDATRENLAKVVLRKARGRTAQEIDWADLRNAISLMPQAARHVPVAELATNTLATLAQDWGLETERMLEARGYEVDDDPDLLNDSEQNFARDEIAHRYSAPTLRLAKLGSDESATAIASLADRVLGPEGRFRVFADLALGCNGPQRAVLVERALNELEKLSDISSPLECEQALCRLIPLIEQADVAKLEAETTRLRSFVPSNDLHHILPSLPETEKAGLISAALEDMSERRSSEQHAVLGKLAPFMNADHVAAALRLAMEVSTKADIPDLISGLARHLRGAALQLALDCLQEMPNFQLIGSLSSVVEMAASMSPEQVDGMLDLLSERELEQQTSEARIVLYRQLPSGLLRARLDTIIEQLETALNVEAPRLPQSTPETVFPFLQTDQRHQVLSLIMQYPRLSLPGFVEALLAGELLTADSPILPDLLAYIRATGVGDRQSLIPQVSQALSAQDKAQLLAELPDIDSDAFDFEHMPAYYWLSDSPDTRRALIAATQGIARQFPTLMLRDNYYQGSLDRWVYVVSRLDLAGRHAHATAFLSTITDPALWERAWAENRQGGESRRYETREHAIDVLREAFLLSATDLLSGDELLEILRTKQVYPPERLAASVAASTHSAHVFSEALRYCELRDRPSLKISDARLSKMLEGMSSDQVEALLEAVNPFGADPAKLTIGPFLPHLSVDRRYALARDALEQAPEHFFAALPELLKDLTKPERMRLVARAFDLVTRRPIDQRSAEFLARLAPHLELADLSTTQDKVMDYVCTLPRGQFLTSLRAIWPVFLQTLPEDAASTIFLRLVESLSDWR